MCIMHTHIHIHTYIHRWEKLSSLIGEALRADIHTTDTHTSSTHDLFLNGRIMPSNGTFLFTRFIWENSRIKEDLLEYLLRLNKHSPTPVLQPGFDQDKKRQDAWLQDSFDPGDIENEDALAQAALSVLDRNLSHEEFSKNFEMLAAGMSAVHAFRSPVRVERHVYRGGKEVRGVFCSFCVHINGR
jgi:hypothetical protein